MMLSFKRLLTATFLVVAAFPVSNAGTASPRDTNNIAASVNLGYEIHQATYNSSGQYYNFTNIRYAQPPLGNLRFTNPQAPQYPAKGQSPPVVSSTNHISCVQALPEWISTSTAWIVNGTNAFDIAAGYTPPNVTELAPPVEAGYTEDCLFLDVFVPKKVWDNRFWKKAPVMVWIHGGGYTLGSKTLYSPSAAGLLARSQTAGDDGIIWVAMNYRLGIFGFLSGPTFQENGTANLGLLDQRFALDWVQSNIHLFGGDKGRVTLAGESAGGGSTFHQITAYGGLKGPVPFQQAIVQSPGFQMSPSPVLQEAIYSKFLSTAGVSTLQQARGLDTNTLQLVNYKIIGESWPYGTFTFNPVVDGNFAPALPGKLLLQGGFDKSLKIITGHNLNEGYEFQDAFAQNETVFENDFRVYFPTITDDQIQYLSKVLYPPVFDGSYGYTSYTGRADLMISEAFFTCSTFYLQRTYTNLTKSWAYHFSVPPSLHGIDIPYTYYNGPNPSAVINDTLAEALQTYLTSFVVTGDPNTFSKSPNAIKNLPYFPQWGGENVAAVLNLNATFIATAKDDVVNERCRWWQKGLYY